MKRYPVFLILSVAACGGDNGALFDDIEGPLSEVEAPPADGSEDRPAADDPGDEADPANDDPARADEGPPGDLPIGGPDELPDDETEEPVVTEPERPSIVSVTPTDGAVGVSNEQPIVVTFSTPMDRQATERAYQSEGIPSSSVSFSWRCVLIFSKNHLWPFVKETQR
jgi:hypothetical protein